MFRFRADTGTIFRLRSNPGTTTLLRNAVLALPREREFSVSVSFVELIVQTSRFGGLFAKLTIPRLSLDRFRCRAPICMQVDPDEFVRCLTRGDGCRLGIFKRFERRDFPEEGEIRFVARNMNIANPDIDEFHLTTIEEHPLMVSFRFNNVYRVIIGIPAEEFIRLIRHLHQFGTSVSVHATHAEVKISAENETVVYKTQHLECVVGGIWYDQSVSFNLSLRFLDDIINVCELSTAVWILYAQNLHPVLVCPIATLGNMMLVPEWASII